MRALLPLLPILFAAACGSSSSGFPDTSTNGGTTKPKGGAPEAGAPSGPGPVGGGGASDDAGASIDAAFPPDDASAGDASAGDASTACTIGSAGAGAFIPGGTMAPGTACITCHVATGSKKLNFAGTVYTAPHEADLCLGVASGVTVVITDAQGTDHTLQVDTSGNFYDDSVFGFSTPYKAKVVGPNGSAEMIGAQTSGDCNSCHTSPGAQGAAGRILGP